MHYVRNIYKYSDPLDCVQYLPVMDSPWLNRVPPGKFNGVKMDIAHQLPKVGIFLAHDRFIAVLPPAPLPARRADRPEGRAYASERIKGHIVYDGD